MPRTVNRTPKHVYSVRRTLVRLGLNAAGIALALVLCFAGASHAEAARAHAKFYASFTTWLSSDKWNIEDYGPGGYRACCLGPLNQYYTPANVTESGGALRLRADANYDSGAVTTEGKFSFLYGALSIRAKLPRGPGLWPALWLLPNGSESPAPFEIDLMEELGANPHTVYFTVWQGSSKRGCSASGPDWSAGYHTYTLDWSAGRARWKIDGRTRCTIDSGVSNQPMYLLMNLAIGTSSSWGGAPTSATHFPQELDVDWVRITQ